MSTVMTQAEAAELLRRDDLPCVVGWSWFEVETTTDAYDFGVEDGMHEVISFARKLIRDAGGDPESQE